MTEMTNVGRRLTDEARNPQDGQPARAFCGDWSFLRRAGFGHSPWAGASSHAGGFPPVTGPFACPVSGSPGHPSAWSFRQLASSAVVPRIASRGGLAGWFRERLPVSGVQLAELTNEPVPNHLRYWWFCLGGTPAYLFVVQIVTGIMLAFYYQPSAGTAYESVRRITEEVSYGWYFRSVHKWAATLMVAAVILHQMRVYFTGAYRKPREINWMVGMCLLLCTLMVGFTGYCLVFEQLSYWGAKVGANISDTIPVVGGFAKRMLLAGDDYNENTVPRFFMLHAAVLPATMILLIAVHIGIVRLQGVSEFRVQDEPPQEPRHFDFFPDHFYTELIIGLVLMILLSALATVFPAVMGPRADPLTTPEVIKPEWFFYATFRWLKLFSATFAVLSMGLIVFVMFTWPFIDALLRRATGYEDISVWIGIVGVFLLVGLTTWEAIVAH